MIGISANLIPPFQLVGHGQLMPVKIAKSCAHVVEVDSDILQGGLDVLVTVELGDRLDGRSGMVEVATECSPEGMVAELDAETVPYLVDDSTVETVAPLGVCTGLRLVHVMAPEEEVVRHYPCGVV